MGNAPPASDERTDAPPDATRRSRERPKRSFGDFVVGVAPCPRCRRRCLQSHGRERQGHVFFAVMGGEILLLCVFTILRPVSRTLSNTVALFSAAALIVTFILNLLRPRSYDCDVCGIHFRASGKRRRSSRSPSSRSSRRDDAAPLDTPSPDSPRRRSSSRRSSRRRSSRHRSSERQPAAQSDEDGRPGTEEIEWSSG